MSRAHKDDKQSLGLQLQLQRLLKGMRGFRRGRRSGCESQEVLSRQALGNVPLKPVTREARKWRKSGISLGRPLVSFVIPAHKCLVSCDFGEVSGYPGLRSLAYNSRV